ncbi:hypothetical protein E2562_020115 [Oryza meyeriana var. granulata]|uniref:Uncharacterized protein n=1 Tax=Oryza meyeriana var. granulata TaxID=110450 RepID=A0A6G1EBM5_9ORYZ|nr:hypothetical protein E2562_020115 [Oryza meyeriana var. granulata]
MMDKVDGGLTVHYITPSSSQQADEPAWECRRLSWKGLQTRSISCAVASSREKRPAARQPSLESLVEKKSLAIDLQWKSPVSHGGLRQSSSILLRHHILQGHFLTFRPRWCDVGITR